jgi:hypothetical protein
METIGDGQNIETLFRDLRMDVEREAPQFAAIWNAAQPRPATRSGLTLSFVSAVIVLVVCLSSFVLWFIRRQVGPQHNTANMIVPGNTRLSSTPLAFDAGGTPVMPISKSNLSTKLKRNLRPPARHRASTEGKGELEIPNTIAVLNWQSPTTLLMQSPSDDLLEFLPQFHQSVAELETFLSETLQ